MSHISVDQDLCMSSEYCTRANPELFSLDEDGIAGLVDGGPGPIPLREGQLSAALAASRTCPSGAIEVVTDP